MSNRWLPLILRGLIAVLLIAIVASAWFVIQVALTKPTTPRTAAERSIIDGEEAVKADPSSVQARLLLASAYAGAGQFANSEKQLNIAIKMEPKNVRAHYMLGVVYKDEGKMDDAINILTKAAKLEGEAGDVYNDIYYELGTAYMAKGDYNKAIDAFIEGEQYGMPLYMLKEKAVSFEKVGAKEEAKITYLNILARDIENQEALAALKRLGVPKSVIDETIRDSR
ncbi:MAG: tetratricopeptide repeat protein [Candidatus Aquicultorales bacterium]